MPEEFVLQLKAIGKAFFGTTVLKNVDLSVKPGEIHALVGENGAGKSTLMNILFGMPVIKDTGGFEGQMVFEGKQIKMESPRQAMEMGIGMVHQEFMLLPGFTATENIKLNREITTKNPVSAVFGRDFETLDIKSMRKDAKDAIGKLGLSIEDWVAVAGLPVGYKQFIEIAREIDKKNVKLLVLDEPTAVLTETEAEKLLDAMKKLSKSGIAMLFITHRLDEVLAVADNITILRDGEVVARMPRSEAKVERIAEIMVGRSIEKIDLPKRKKEPSDDDIILEIKNLKVNMTGENVKGVDLNVRRGEILGIGGLAGHGKVGIANGVMGLYPSTGEVFKDGKPVKLNNPYDALSA
ncbi:MAG TPA: ATP-binding cassette domain-containing protein, partial [Bacillota bacterium]|nr:ATP-binding cassette domain-containing protein [Bacillota bacterium]